MKSSTLITIALISLFIFAILLAEINKNPFIFLDLSANSYIPKIQNHFFISFFRMIGIIFDTLIILLISLLLSGFLWIKSFKKESVFLSFTIILNSVIIFLLKNFIQRTRPLNALILENSFSFPSGHTTTAVVFFGILSFLIFKKMHSISLKIFSIIFSIFMMLLIGFSRLYLNVHWATDILAGFSLGIFIISLSILMFENIKFN
ncbi:MAG: phosphatase PAP2 family protein [Nanoarchaeota archaeon]